MGRSSLETKTVSVILETVGEILARGGKVVLQYITGHSGEPHSDKVDKLARDGSAQPQPDHPMTQLGGQIVA